MKKANTSYIPNFKTVLIAIAVISLTIASFAMVASAQEQGGTTNRPAEQGGTTNQIVKLTNPLKVDNIGDAVKVAIEVFTFLVILFAVLALVWVGFQFVLSRGNTERMKELRKWLFNIIIGVAIVIGARIMIEVIINTLRATGTVDESVLQSADDALRSR